MPTRLAVVTSHPIQYQGPFFRALAAHPDVALEVFFCCDHGQRESYDREFATKFAWQRPIAEGYAHEYVPSIHPSPGPYGFFSLTNPGLWTRLTRARCDVVMLVGWGFASCWIALAAARAHGLGVLLRGESGVDAPKERSFLKEAARRALLARMFERVDAFLSIGTHNAELYRSFGVPEERLFLTPYAVDNEHFLERAREVEPRRAELRAALGVHDDRPIILTSGKLSDRKAPLDLLEAFIALHPKLPAKLVYVGDGPLRDVVTARARAAGVASDVLVTGFRDQDALPELYAAGDIFAFPTHFETWGLVVNEAMLFKLPVVCTQRVPAHWDLVVPGETGDIYPAGDVEALAGILEARLSDRPRLAAMGRTARARVVEWNIERGVTATVTALAWMGAARGA